MSHRYERIHHVDAEDLDVNGDVVYNSNPTPSSSFPSSSVTPIPNSPPPSFHSRPGTPDSNSALADSFDTHSEEDDDDGDMRNLHRGNTGGLAQSTNLGGDSTSATQTTSMNIFRGLLRNSEGSSGRRTVMGGGQTDGVFANLSAKPEVGEKLEELPPTYEQAAADATPPYWETTILTPGMASNVVFIDGLPVGSVYSFVWNALISMSFQYVGFLLTYLLHTTHAAKDGSRAGLGVTLVQVGFMMRNKQVPAGGEPPPETTPSEPNAFNFDGAPDISTDTSSTSGEDNMGRYYLSYILMVVGWFILIRSVSSFLRARRTEQVVLASPDRGLGMAIVGENEDPERVV